MVIDWLRQKLKSTPEEHPTGVQLLALAGLSPEAVEVLSDGELVGLEKLCHKSLEVEESESPLVVTAEGIKVG